MLSSGVRTSFPGQIIARKFPSGVHGRLLASKKPGTIGTSGTIEAGRSAQVKRFEPSVAIERLERLEPLERLEQALSLFAS
jgi:hypothetical protein